MYLSKHVRGLPEAKVVTTMFPKGLRKTRKSTVKEKNSGRKIEIMTPGIQIRNLSDIRSGREQPPYRLSYSGASTNRLDSFNRMAMVRRI
jgi:hypothetical protein